MRLAAILALLVLPAAADDVVAKLKTQLGSSDEGERADAAHQLGKLGPRAKAAAPALTKALGDEASWVADLAFEALRGIGPDSVPALVKGLASSDGEVRARAMRLLDESFTRDLKPYLRQVAACLKDGNPAIRKSAAHALAQHGEDVFDLLMSAFGAREEGAQDAAVASFAAIGGTAVPTLLKALAGGSEKARVGAVRALGEMKATGTAKDVFAAMSDKSPEVAAAAARASALIGELPEIVIPRLAEGLRSPDAGFRAACIDALATWGRPAAPALGDALGAADTRESATLALLRMEGRGATLLGEVLDKGTDPVRCAALAALGRMNPAFVDADARRGIGPLLHDESVAVRIAAVECLGHLGPAARDKRIREGLSHRDPALRAACFHTLGELGMDAEKWDDEDPLARIQARLAEWKVHGGTGEDLKKIAFDATKETRLRVAAISAIGEMGLGANGIDLSPLLEKEPVEIRRAAVAALAATTLPSAIAIREARAATPPQRAVEAGLAWLAKAQSESGAWQSGRLTAGVTGIVLLSYLGANKGPDDPTYGANVRCGLHFLLESQKSGAVLSDTSSHEWVLCHGIATLALAEAYLMTGEYRYRRAAQWGVDYIAFARNPGLAWRYSPRDGENDTHLSTWLLFALRLADAAGLRVDPAAYEGAGAWIELMTGRSGRTGYNSQGGVPARPEGRQESYPAERVETMTAAGLWCRHLLGGPYLEGPRYKNGIDLVLAREPSWAPGYQDMIYWHFAALALFQDGDASYRKWSKPLVAALAVGQEMGGDWRADEVWALDLENPRIYTTAMGVLTLLAPVRYPRGFATRPRVDGATAAAITAIRKARSDEDAGVREIADAAWARLG
ncbi:MAG TPA: HEAT repeat domain-containing protein [Planctomycetota bacterium]|nr:HEAT repeat domain-containing protein [Planctomycetota bacterium]